jgi:hypothetical protein
MSAPETTGPAMVVGILIGALLRHIVPLIWREASDSDRLDAMTRNGPLPRRRK